MSRTRFVLFPLAPCLAALACAQASPPPGGVQDRLPPRIVATTPDTLAVVPGFDGPVVFRFDERISERGITNMSALVSPRTGDVRVKRGKDEIRVELSSGWLPGLIYRVLLVPGVRDLFGNELKVPSELVFSTGPQVAGAVIAGVVTDRITGRPAQRVFIDATLRSDSITYVTTIDSASFYAFRYMAPGIYDMVAWADQNGNGKRDASESASRRQVLPVNRDGDTAVVELAVIPFDTTPPRITRAEFRDSLQIRVFSDDYIDPASRLDQARITILQLPDSTEVPGPYSLMSLDSFNALPKAPPDSMGKDTAGVADTISADSLAGRGPPPISQGRASAGRGPPPRSTSPFGAPTEPLPFQELVLVPASPLEPGRTYLVDIRGLVNIAGRPNGGGEVEVTVPEPKPPPPDTSGASPRLRRPGR